MIPAIQREALERAAVEMDSRYAHDAAAAIRAMKEGA